MSYVWSVDPSGKSGTNQHLSTNNQHQHQHAHAPAWLQFISMPQRTRAVRSGLHFIEQLLISHPDSNRISQSTPAGTTRCTALGIVYSVIFVYIRGTPGATGYLQKISTPFLFQLRCDSFCAFVVCRCCLRATGRQQNEHYTLWAKETQGITIAIAIAITVASSTRIRQRMNLCPPFRNVMLHALSTVPPRCLPLIAARIADLAVWSALRLNPHFSSPAALRP